MRFEHEKVALPNYYIDDRAFIRDTFFYVSSVLITPKKSIAVFKTLNLGGL
jgi:hypothetical protein